MMRKSALALVSVIALAAADLAAAAPRHAPRPPAFRAHGLQQPVAPRVLSHAGLPGRFHGTRFRANGLQQPLATAVETGRHERRRIPHPVVIGLPLLVGAPAMIYRAASRDGIADEAPRAVHASVGAKVGCTIEEIAVPGDKGEVVVGVIRC